MSYYPNQEKPLLILKTYQMKKITICLALLTCTFLSIAQQKALTIQGTSPDIYLVHSIAAKENFYSIGRLYNASPHDIATYNNLVFEKGLTLGQSIKIPLTQNNFTQEEVAKPEEALIPLYHVVQAKEGLYRVSINYYKVPLDALKKWNKLQNDVVSNGTKLIVGYLKVLKDQSPLAGKDVLVNKTDVAVKKPVENKPDLPKERVPTVKNPEVVAVKPKETLPVKQEPKETIPVKQEPKEIVSDPVATKQVDHNGGAFKKLFGDQKDKRSLVNANGSAEVFKTTSGWQDGKYYCFLNDAQPGTIIKITNNATNKSVYAKVLDAVPDIKQNEGLLLRVSNSAAEELGAGENRFDCSISYAK